MPDTVTQTPSSSWWWPTKGRCTGWHCGCAAAPKTPVRWRRTGLPAFRGDSRFSSWLYRLTTNAAIDFLRREKHHLGNLPLEEAPERPDPQQPELLAEQREQQEALQRALDQLSPEHRQVLLLRVVQQMSYDEIARALSLESGTVKSRISRARRQLREILLRQGNFFSDSAVLPNRKEG